MLKQIRITGLFDIFNYDHKGHARASAAKAKLKRRYRP